MNKELLRTAIELKLSLAQTTPKKFYALARRVGLDGRLHDNFKYCGAGHTGRWASLGINLQNLMRPIHKDVDAIISYLTERNPDILEMLWDDPMKAISCCIRGMLIAKPGHRLIVVDYSSIEAVGIAWLAGEEDALEIFRTHGKIYEYAASQIFKMAIEDIAKDSDERFAGKTTILACGFQGGWKALQKMARDNGVELTDKFCNEIVTKWRKKNPNIVNYWDALQKCAIHAIKNPGEEIRVSLSMENNLPDVRYIVKRNTLFCKLPSGRLLSYHSPSLTMKTVTGFKIAGEFPRNIVYHRDTHGSALDFRNLAARNDSEIYQFESPTIRFWGVDSKTYKWTRLATYGGSLAENTTQAVARDLLAHGMLKARDAGYPIVLHVHDEPTAEMPEGQGSWEELVAIMIDLPEWAAGLPVSATGYEAERYRK